MRRVVYLTWGETPRGHGLYRSQVIETVRSLADHLPASEFTLIAGVPVIHSGMIREKWRYPQEITALRQILGRSQFERALIPVPQSFVHPTRRSFNMIFAGARFFLLPRLQRIAPDIVHCRSLQAAWIAHKLREAHGLSYRILYDARSLWPEMQYRLNPNADDLAAFKALEAELVQAVDSVVSVNQPMADHYRALGAPRSWVNYLAATLPDKLPPPPAPNPIRLFYAGALHHSGMQDPVLLFRLLAQVDKLSAGAELTILTTSPHPPLRALATQFAGPAAARIRYAAARSPAEVMQTAAQHHIACNVYRAPITANDRALCATGFSTKSAEYMAAGLPILVSRHPAAIGHLVSENSVGYVFDDTQNDLGLNIASLNAMMHPSMRTRCRSTAAAHFDRDRVSAQFAAIYTSLAPRSEGAAC